MDTKLNETLFENLIHELLLHSKDGFYMAKIHKLLYFLEFNYLERNEKELTGENFIKNKFGPTSINLKKYLDKLIQKGLITSQEDGKGKEIYFSVSDKKYKFNKDVKLELDFLIKKYIGLTTKQIADLSHEDNPYRITDDFKIIDKQSVFFRTSNFSVFE